jgi:copper transport protein
MSRYTARYARWIGLAAALMIVIAPRVALAHAHLVRSMPAAGSHLGASPTQLQLWYSEAPVAAMTVITITGPGGISVPVGKISTDPGNSLLLTAPLSAQLAAGEYTLTWRTVADDGHPSNGSFKFTVDGSAAAAGSIDTAAGSIAASDAKADVSPAASAAANSDQTMAVEAPGYVIARWLNFLGIIIAIGVIVFRVLVVPATIAQDESTSFASFRGRAIHGAATLGLVAGLIVIVASVCRLLAERAVLGAGISIGTIMNSFWGRVWIEQLVAAIIACFAFALARGAQQGTQRNGAWLVATLAVLALGTMPALSGHAIAASEHRNISVALDIIHVLAAGGWLGGLCALVLAGVPAALATRAEAQNAEAAAGLSLIARLVNAFSPIALVLASCVVVTGAIAAWMHVGSFALLFNSRYGTVLLIKLVFVVLVIAGGAFNWRRMRGALSRHDTEQTAVGTFRRSAGFELAAGVLVIAVTAVLVAAQPPLH